MVNTFLSLNYPSLWLPPSYLGLLSKQTPWEEKKYHYVHLINRELKYREMKRLARVYTGILWQRQCSVSTLNYLASWEVCHGTIIRGTIERGQFTAACLVLCSRPFWSTYWAKRECKLVDSPAGFVMREMLNPGVLSQGQFFTPQTNPPPTCL